MEGTVTIKLKDFEELKDKASSVDKIAAKWELILDVKLPGSNATIRGLPEVREIATSR